MAVVAIVEDQKANMKLVSAILAQAGYDILPAFDAIEGVPLIQEHIPDLVLMDIHLPGMDGLEATRILKNDTTTKHIPIVALTARAMEGDREQILAQGCDDYLSKPIRYKELLDLVAQHLERH